VALEVVWSAAALRDRRSIFKYWIERNGSPTYSLKLYQQWEAVIRVISINPYIGRPTDLPGIRVKLVGPYNIFYLPSDKLLHIVRIIDGRRDMSRLKVV
jgi:plasmid stabilization system protein ParE